MTSPRQAAAGRSSTRLQSPRRRTETRPALVLTCVPPDRPTQLAADALQFVFRSGLKRTRHVRVKKLSESPGVKPKVFRRFLMAEQVADSGHATRPGRQGTRDQFRDRLFGRCDVVLIE